MAEPSKVLIDTVIAHLRTQLQETGIARIKELEINSIGPDEVQVGLIDLSPMGATNSGPGPKRAQFDCVCKLSDSRSTAKAIELQDQLIRILTRFEPIPRWGSVQFIKGNFRSYDSGLTIWVSSFSSLVPISL